MILFLEPYFEQKPWADDKLNKLYDCPINTGEAWIISGYKGKSSIIKNGQYKGLTLDKLWQTKPYLFGNYNDKDFPLLVKLISARENLSIQVHPDDNYALKRHNSLGKFECWYILPETTADSVICDMTISRASDIKSTIENGMIESYLIERPIVPDDLVVIEPGTVHAIKADTFLLEIQESSDITYRLYDYNREPKRELHIEDSLNVIVNNPNKNPVYPFKDNATLKNEHFNIYKLNIDSKVVLDNKGFELFYVIDGEGNIEKQKIIKGDSFIILPDKNKKIVIDGNLSILCVVPKNKQERLNMLRKKALITGISSQDGIEMTRFLLKKGYEVHGIITNSNCKNNFLKIDFCSDKIDKNLFFHLGDLSDSSNINRIIEKVKPDEIYHLAGQNHVDSSFEIPEYTTEVNSLGTLRILDAIKESSFRTKLFNMSTCQLYSGEIYPQDETTLFDPKSPYAVSKLYAHYIVKNYRESYKLYAVNGICYNHDSIYNNSFVYKKIIDFAKKLKNGEKSILEIGNLNSVREWGITEDYCEAMWLSLQQNEPEDYVIGFGNGKTIRDWITIVLKEVGINIKFEGTGLDEIGVDENGDILVKINAQYFRPTDAKVLVSNPKKIYEKTGWKPKNTEIDFIRQLLKVRD